MTSRRPIRREPLPLKGSASAPAPAGPAAGGAQGARRRMSGRSQQSPARPPTGGAPVAPQAFVSWGLPGRILVLAITLLGAVAHGYYSNRWHQSDDLRQRAGVILEELPQDFGDWKLEANVPFADNVQGILLFAGAINRRYVHQTTGDVVSVAVIVGPPGPTSTHTAALCYGSRGYDSSSPIETVELDVAGRRHEIARSQLRPESPGLRPLEVCYAWRQADQWCTPEVPRVAFGGGDYLFKFQIAVPLADDGNAAEDSVGLKFLEQFLPVLEEHVFDRLNEPPRAGSETAEVVAPSDL